MKARAFFFHYNKPASAKAGEPRITVHYKQRCLIVRNVVCSVPTHGRIGKRQPRFVVCGKANDITIKEGVAVIS